jgi:hypothetical protein
MLMQWQQKQAADKGQSHNHAHQADVSPNFFFPQMLEQSVSCSFTRVRTLYDISEQLLRSMSTIYHI